MSFWYLRSSEMWPTGGFFLWVSSHTFKYHKLISYWRCTSVNTSPPTYWQINKTAMMICFSGNFLIPGLDTISITVLNKVYMWETLYEVILHFTSFSSQFDVWSQLSGNKLKLKTEVHCFCNRQSSIFNITTHHMIVCYCSKWHTWKEKKNKNTLVFSFLQHAVTLGWPSHPLGH